MDAPTPATLSIPFVYLRQKGVSGGIAHRIPYPSSMKGLMNSANRYFGHVMSIQSLITESGQMVNSLSDIIEGMTVFVSNRAVVKRSPPRNTPSPVVCPQQIISKESFELLFGTGGVQSSVEDVADKPISLSPKKQPAQKPKFAVQPDDGSKPRRLVRPNAVPQSQTLAPGLFRTNLRRDDRDHAENGGAGMTSFGLDDLMGGSDGGHRKEARNRTCASENEGFDELENPGPRKRRGRRSGQGVGTKEDSDFGNRRGRRGVVPERETNDVDVDDGAIRRRNPGIGKEQGSNGKEPENRWANRGSRGAAASRREDNSNSVTGMRRGKMSIAYVDAPKPDGHSDSGSGVERRKMSGSSTHASKTDDAPDSGVGVKSIHASAGQVSEEHDSSEITADESYNAGYRKRHDSRRQNMRGKHARGGEDDSKYEVEAEAKNTAPVDGTPRGSPSRRRRAAHAAGAQKSPSMIKHVDQSVDSSEECSDSDICDREESHVKMTEDCQPMEALFAELLAGPALRKQLPNALSKLPDVSESLTHIPSLEAEYISFWRNSIMDIASQHGFSSLDDVSGVDDMIGRARCLLMEHRFAIGGAFSHRHNIGVIGPRGSGKSAFLRVLAEETLVDLIVTGEWKKTFVFVLDFTTLVSIASDFAALYHAVVTATMRLIRVQRPDVNHYMSMIEKCFMNVTELSKPPQFPRSFVVDENTRSLAMTLQHIIDSVSMAWNSSEALATWTLNMVTLPKQIASAFGFTRTLAILDHIDVADIMFEASDQFIESPESVCVIDVIKYAMKAGDYIVACKDQSCFYSIMPPCNGCSQSSLEDTIKLVSLVDLIVDDDSRQFHVDLTTESQPITVTVAICGGIPSYLQLWSDLNGIFDDIDAANGDVEELQSIACVQMQQALRTLVFQDDTEDCEVTRVRRSTKG